MPADRSGVATALALVAGALSVPAGTIDAGSGLYKTAAWDSFGQLTVVLAIEEATGVRVDDEATFERLTSVAGIAEYLAEIAAR